MRPFEGIRVLDLTHVLAGPFCTFQLGVMGADVIKIEAPDRPDMTRIEGVVPGLNDDLYGTYFQSQNGAKRAITLDLATDGGRAVMERLIPTADVLVQNYAGEALDDLGFGYEAAAALNPQLIYCTLTGFGRSSPKADDPAYDIVIQAWSGLMAANVAHPDGPVRVGPPMVDYGTGAQAAFAIAGALFQRSRTGRGQRIDVAMLDSAVMLMSAIAAETEVLGTPPVPHGNQHVKYAGYATFPTAEGLLMIGAWSNTQLARLLDLLGEAARAAEVRRTPRRDIARHLDADRALIARHMTARSADDWETALNAARVPAARVRTVDEALGSEQLAARPVMQQVPGAQGAGPARLPVAGFSYAHGSPQLDRAPPRLGEHTGEILTELGFSQGEITALGAAGAI